MPASQFDEPDDGNAICGPPSDCLGGGGDYDCINFDGQLSCHQVMDAESMHNAPELSSRELLHSAYGCATCLWWQATDSEGPEVMYLSERPTQSASF